MRTSWLRGSRATSRPPATSETRPSMWRCVRLWHPNLTPNERSGTPFATPVNTATPGVHRQDHRHMGRGGPTALRAQSGRVDLLRSSGMLVPHAPRPGERTLQGASRGAPPPRSRRSVDVGRPGATRRPVLLAQVPFANAFACRLPSRSCQLRVAAVPSRLAFNIPRARARCRYVPDRRARTRLLADADEARRTGPRAAPAVT